MIGWVFVSVGTQVGGLVAADGGAELVVVAGENGVEDDTAQSSDGKTRQGDGCITNHEGHAAHSVEAQTADEHHGGDDQVAGLGEIHFVFHHIPHTHGGDHTVEDEADAAHDGGGDGVDQCVKLGGEAEDDGVDGGQTDDPGIVYLAQSQHAGVFTVGSVGGAAHEGGDGGGQTVTQQGAVQTGIGDEILAGGGGDGGHIADMLHHGGDGDGSHDQDGGQVELGYDELLQGAVRRRRWR